MRRLEETFGKPHPALANYKPLAPQLEWLQAAFIRLHRRRQISQAGVQPLSHQDLMHFAEKVLRLPDAIVDSFVRIMEHTDNAVLSDFYNSRN